MSSPAPSWRFSDAVRSKARRYLAAGRVKRDEERPDVFYVHGRGDSPYRVQVIGTDEAMHHVRGASCTCRHGLNNIGRPICAHVVAALLLLRESQTAATLKSDPQPKETES